VIWTARELAAMPTLTVGQADDLKIDLPGLRVWLSRCSVEDGEDSENQVYVERYIDDRWKTVESYPGGPL
jgi:hypothetical protein